MPCKLPPEPKFAPPCADALICNDVASADNVIPPPATIDLSCKFAPTFCAYKPSPEPKFSASVAESVADDGFALTNFCFASSYTNV